MPKRATLLLAAALFVLVTLGASSAGSQPLPTGERAVGNGSVFIGPVYDFSGAIGYITMPQKVSRPVQSSPSVGIDFYMVQYPITSTVGTLNCLDFPVENCPDHGPAQAEGAAFIMPSVYGAGSLGHDHLMDTSNGNGPYICHTIFVLFTNPFAANEHITTKAQLDAAAQRFDVIEIPIPLSFICGLGNEALYNRGVPTGG